MGQPKKKLTKEGRQRMRVLLYFKQSGQCCYCERGMWMRGSEGRETAKRRLGVWTNGEVESRMATLEHLRRICEGGDDSSDNLALSCHGCNTRRGNKTWLEWKSHTMGEAA